MGLASLQHPPAAALRTAQVQHRLNAPVVFGEEALGHGSGAPGFTDHGGKAGDSQGRLPGGGARGTSGRRPRCVGRGHRGRA